MSAETGSLQVSAPLAGTIVPLAEVPDPVFAQGMVGPGVAIRPGQSEHIVQAPVPGRLMKLKPHAFVIMAGRRAVLVHLGIDTVHLDGAGFTLLAEEGQLMTAGQPIVRWDTGPAVQAGLSPISPVVALDAAADIITITASGPITAGADIFSWGEAK